MRVSFLLAVLTTGCTPASTDKATSTPSSRDSATDTADTQAPTDTADPGPIPTGLTGGWTVDHTGAVLGATFVHPHRTDKDGALVAARVASALGGLGVPATSDARDAVLDPTRMADETYGEEVAAFVVDDLYGRLAQAGNNPQLGTDTVVLTSVHRFGLYVGETLHARVLPLQVISFAEDWSQVEAAARRATLIVGQDFDYDGLWLWNKLGAGAPGTAAAALPEAYVRAVAEAEHLVLVQPNDNWTLCTATSCVDAIGEVYTGGDSAVYLHSSLTRSDLVNRGTTLYADAVARGLVAAAPEAEVANLKQWEWGVPDSTVDNVRALWASLGKPPEDLVVIRGGVVDMFAWTPWLWRAYLNRNGVTPTGIHLLAYWAAWPGLERGAGILPLPSYTYFTPDWHPLDDNARALLTELCVADCGPELGANTRAFVNSIGSAADPDAMAALLTDYGLTAATGAYLGEGLNSAGAAAWTGWEGAPVAAGWEEVAAAVTDPARCPLATADWSPFTVDELCATGRFACE